MTTLAAIIRKYKKSYCVASQAKLLILLDQHYHVEIQRRMLNYHLADLRKAGMIKTIKRTHRKSDGTIVLLTSATCLTPIGYYELFKLGCGWAKRQYDKLMSKYCPKIHFKSQKTEGMNEEEQMRRRKLGKDLFKSPEFRAIWGMDDPPDRAVPNF